MESYRVQQDIAMGKVPSRQQSKNQQEIINGDFFAAFLQLITQGGEENQSDILSQLTSSDEEPNAMAMEIMADLLNGNAGLDLLMNDNLTDLVTNPETANNSQVLQQLMTSQSENVSNLPISDLNAILTNGVQFPVQKDKQLDPLSFQRQIVSLGDNKTVNENVALNTVTAKGGSNSSEMLFEGSMNFQNAIMQAQKLIKGESKATSNTADDPDAQALQQAIGQTKFDAVINDKQVLSPEQTSVDVADLSQQVKNGISSGVLGEQKEFLVKLKPEGLGEVTIKLVESQNKMTVSIVTATSEVAKLLNNELPTLREAMRAMQIDLREVVVQQQNSFANMQQDLQQHMFQGNSNQFSQGNRHTNGTFSDFSSETESEIQGANSSYLSDDRMNIYV